MVTNETLLTTLKTFLEKEIDKCLKDMPLTTTSKEVGMVTGRSHAYHKVKDLLEKLEVKEGPH